MSRAKVVEQEFQVAETDIENSDKRDLRTVRNCIARAYDAGYLEGSGQSSITALEREVIVAALEWLVSESPMHADNKLIEVTQELKAALEKAETE